MLSRNERYISILILLTATVVTLWPIIVLIDAAFAPNTSSSSGISLFHDMSLSSFRYAWVQGDFGTYMLNTVIVTGGVVVLSVAVATAAAYSVAVLRPPGGSLLLFAAIVAFMLPVEVLIVPWYYELQTLGWLDSYVALIVTQGAVSSGFGIFWMTAAFRSVPSSLREAAMLDGDSGIRLMWHIYIPSVLPAVRTMGALVFLWTWNSFLVPLVLTSSASKFVVTVGLASFQGAHFTQYGALAAGSLLAALPVVLVYLLSQRSFITGMFAGANVG